MKYLLLALLLTACPKTENVKPVGCVNVDTQDFSDANTMVVSTLTYCSKSVECKTTEDESGALTICKKVFIRGK